MKVRLEFDLPEEQESFNDALNGDKYRSILLTIDEELRNRFKYRDEDTVTIEEVRELIHNLLDSYNISLY